MTGRGLDQVLPTPGSPALYEPSVRDARDYVRLAERTSGAIPRQAPAARVWGEALEVLEGQRPDLRIINLETAVTTASRPATEKGIHYRMHPGNIRCLQAARIDCCALANNHVLDWSRAGLEETLAVLDRHGIQHAGAGRDAAEASAPAVLTPERGARLLVFSCAAGDSGVPVHWNAAAERPGVFRLEALSRRSARALAAHIRSRREPGDRVMLSIHWGGNWGFNIPQAHRDFARALVEEGVVDLVHGHSSHHVRGFEVYRGRLILYGCGDFINDYEGIGGHEQFRGELSVMYFPRLDPDSGALDSLVLVPTRMRRMRIERATGTDRQWLLETLRRESGFLDPRIVIEDSGDCFQVEPPRD